MPWHRLPARTMLGLLACIAVAGCGAWMLWRQLTPPPQLPAIELDGADPEIARAVQEARAAVEYSPRSATSWGQLAMVLHANALESAADSCYAAAAELDPQNPTWLYLRGYLHQSGPGGPEAALPLYERSADLGRPNSVARLRMADMLLAQGRWDDAEQQYNTVLSADPRDANALLGLAGLAIARQQYSTALTLLEPLTNNPLVQQRACELLASAHERLGNRAAAEVERQRRSRLLGEATRPDDPMNEVGQREAGLGARVRMSTRLQQQQRFSESLALLKETVEKYPQADDAWSYLAAALASMNDLPGAERALAKSVALVPESAEYRLNLGMLQLSQQNYEAAAESFRKCLELRPTQGQAHMGLGESLLGLNDRRGAEDSFREALRHLPDNELIRERLRQLQSEQPATPADS